MNKIGNFTPLKIDIIRRLKIDWILRHILTGAINRNWIFSTYLLASDIFVINLPRHQSRHLFYRDLAAHANYPFRTRVTLSPGHSRCQIDGDDSNLTWVIHSNSSSTTSKDQRSQDQIRDPDRYRLFKDLVWKLLIYHGPLLFLVECHLSVDR